MAKQKPRGDAPVVEPMRPWRVWLAYGVVGVVVLGHGYDIARQVEHWPFSNYPMWARPATEWHIKNVVPVGLTAGPVPIEVELTDPAYFAPLPPHYQKIAFLRVASPRRAGQRERMLRDYLDYYDKRRESRLHDGPPLQGIRLYEDYFDLRRDAANAGKPDRRTLLYEYVRPPGPPASAPATPGGAR
jgi:hypothetical protein